MNYILGASGAVGTAIRSSLNNDDCFIVPKEEYVRWINTYILMEFLETRKVSSNDTIYVCSGVTNPQAPTYTLNLINFQIPSAIVSQSARTKCRIVTFGSILENYESNNPYLDSKRQFFQLLGQQLSNENHKHFQLHTIYGINPPKPHMLLGQISDSIRDKSAFEMSSGLQIREYWHGHDLAQAIRELDWQAHSQKVVKVSSGSPFQLKTLALEIFRYFEVEELLHLSSIPDPANENYDKIITPDIDGIKELMRNPFQGVISYLKEFLKEV